LRVPWPQKRLKKNRATKLQTAVKVSVDKEQIMELFDAAKTEKFKKGWTEV